MFRLLSFDENDSLILTEYPNNVVPPYAILSHTWDSDNWKEVTFEDLKAGRGEEKPRYDKIKFCMRRAVAEKLRYFWIDTCCIDKSSSAELAEAINSMFRYYREARCCWVYLNDVPTNFRAEKDGIVVEEAAFRHCRWFTRGWTLQELIAPKRVEFYAEDAGYLGNRRDLEQVIHEITGIPVNALRGRPLSSFGVDERMSWAKHRKTTRNEDIAYALLGILGVYMVPIYGEGTENAQRRLGGRVREANRCLEFEARQAKRTFEEYTKDDG
jgi:hypothetical protein